MDSPPIIILINKLNFADLFYMDTPKFSRNYRERKMSCLFRLLPISPFQSRWLVYHSHGNHTDVIIQTVSELILGVGPSVYCKKCIIACCSHGNIIQNTFYTLQSFLCSHVHPPSSLTLATNAVFPAFMILPFHECYVVTII